MYEEKKAFPIKWLIIGGASLLLLIIIIAVVANRPDYNQMRKDKISMIEAAAIDYGEEDIDELEANKELCISVAKLIEEGFLKSDSETANVIYDPTDQSNKTLLDDDVYVYYDDEVFSEYKDKDKCDVNYSDLISVTELAKTSSSITLKINVPKSMTVNSIEMTTVDGDKYYTLKDTDTQTFSSITSGEHKVKIRITGDDEQTYDVSKTFTIDKIASPIIKIDETSSDIVIIDYPDSPSDYNYEYYYLINSEDDNLKETVTKDTTSYKFTETGYIIAIVSDGINTTKTDKLTVNVTPACIETSWSTCSGCSASCGDTCSGTQISNCGTSRTCDVSGACDTVSKYSVTLKVTNGTPTSTTVSVESGVSYIFENIAPNSGYVYSSYKCTTGSAVYSSSKGTFLVKDVTNNRTCTLNFVKKTTTIPTYVVTFKSGYDQSVILSKYVQKGSTVSSITAPTVSGYTFTGWTLNGSTYNFSTAITSNITLTANYSKNTVTVTFNANGGSPSKTQAVSVGGLATSYIPIRQGYHFMYWTLNSAQFNFSTPISTAITLNAYWVSTYIKNVVVSCTSSPCNTSYNLVNFNGIHSVTSTSGSVTYTLNGNLINITLNNSTSATVSITYY